MTSARDGAEAAPRAGGGESLKHQYRWQIWIIVAVNTLFLHSVAQANAIKVNGLRAILTDGENMLPVGVALIFATVLTGLLSSEAKARLVFLRWCHALPGHRAFSVHAVRDPRIDIGTLERIYGTALPVDPVEQNRAWYGIYKTVANDIAVRQAHRDFLLLRDYTSLCVLFFVLYGATGLFVIPSVKVGLVYLLVLALQFTFVRHAASNYGTRMVTTVLARGVGKEPPAPLKVTRPRARKPKAKAPEKRG